MSYPDKDFHYLFVPSDTPWEPHKAQALAEHFIASGEYTSLQIIGTHGQLVWRLGTPTTKTQSTLSLFRSLYPAMEIAPDKDFWFDIEYQDDDTTYTWGFDFSHVQPVPMQIVTAPEVKTFDPLISVGSAFSTLRDNEMALLVIEIMPKRPNFDHEIKKQYKKAYTDGFGTKLLEIGLLGLASAANKGAYIHPTQTAEQRMNERDYMLRKQRAQEKIAQPLTEIEMTLDVLHMFDEGRRKEFSKLVFNSLSGFSSPPQSLRFCHVDKKPRLVVTAAELATLVHLPHKNFDLPNVIWAKNTAPMPRVLVGKTDGINIGTGTYADGTSPVHLRYQDRDGHVNIVGKSGMGKSTFMVGMINQDIQNGHGVSVIDPHGDLIRDTLERLPQHREKDVILLDVSDEDYPIALNLVSPQAGFRPDQIARQTLGVLAKIFGQSWRDGSRMQRILSAGLLTLANIKGAILEDIFYLFLDPEYRHRKLAHITDPNVRKFWDLNFEPLTDAQQRERFEPIDHRLSEFLLNPTIKRMLGQPTSLNIRRIMDTRKILLVSLNGFSDIEKNTLGSLLVTKFLMAAMSRANIPDQDQRVHHYLYIDEVQNFVTTPLDKILSEARKYNLSLTIANQFLNQLSDNVLAAVLGNVGASVIFRVGPQDTSALISSVSPSFEKEDLVTLDKFTTATKMQLHGTSLPAFSMTTNPPPEKRDDPQAVIDRIKEQTRSQYARPAAEIDAELIKRYQSVYDPIPDAFKQAFDNKPSAANNAEDELDLYGDKK